MGRTSVYVQTEEQPVSNAWVHENDAVLAFARRMAGPGVSFRTPPEEGKINLNATRDGLLVYDVPTLQQFNMIPDVMCASRQNRIYVQQGKPFAGCRAIPLYLSRERMHSALSVLDNKPLFRIRELKRAKVGILVTGTEVFQGLIQDRFQPIIREKVETFGCSVVSTDIVPDERSLIAASVQRMIESGVELLITTAGLSVDPDDVTRQGLLDAGLTDILYGAPLLPGAMTLLGHIASVSVLGVPACALFFKTTSLDLFLPQLLADVPITRTDLARMAEGGFCLNCQSCTFPKCPFGK
jgi:formylmethanofuran dehydrogenase subunit E